MSCVPRKKYIHIVASLEQVLDLKNTSFEDIVGRLKAYEERVCDDEESQEDQSKLMYANMESQSQPTQSNSRFHGGNRGRGRGGRFNSGRGGYGRGQQSYNYRQGRNMSRIVCYRCDKTGHFALDCLDRLLKLQEIQEDKGNENETEDADELMMHKVVFLNEKNVVPSNYETSPEDDMWYLDNGASNHMTGNHMYFTKLDKEITGKVRFGDDSRIDIKGKGSISFIDKDGERRTMTDVYFIPDLKSNIISLGQATESGCDVRMKEDYLTLHDRDGKLLVKAKRSNNRLYKVRMGLNKAICLQLETMSNSAKWHARLGHINTENMKLMIERDLVTGIPKLKIEKELCASCLLGKQTRQHFPQATSYRATHSLELVYGDLCGPITPSTMAQNRYVFVLIDDYSRYMWSLLLKEKSEAFSRFKKFKAAVEHETG